MNADAIPHLRLGLRFPRSQARVLRNIAGDLRSTRPPGVDISLFDKAAEAAASGEPLIVLCSEAKEVHAMAHAFTALGVREPTIEELPSPH